MNCKVEGSSVRIGGTKVTEGIAIIVVRTAAANEIVDKDHEGVGRDDTKIQEGETHERCQLVYKKSKIPSCSYKIKRHTSTAVKSAAPKAPVIPAPKLFCEFMIILPVIT